MTALSQRDFESIRNKQRNLPSQLARARHRVLQLESECIRYGRKDLLTDPVHAGRAFELAFREAKAFNTEWDQ